MSGSSGKSSGITSDIVGPLMMAAGAAATITGVGAPVGIPLMLGGAGATLGGNLGGWEGLGLGGGSGLLAGAGGEGLAGLGGIGPLAGMLGGGASGATGAAGLGQAAGGAAPALDASGGFAGLGGPAGAVGGMPYYSAAQYANYGAPAANTASFAPPVALPPAALAPSGGGAPTTPASGMLSPAYGGAATPGAGITLGPASAANLQAAGFTPADIQAAQGIGGNSMTSAQEATLGLQGAGTVGDLYLKYLAANSKEELAKPFQSTVIPQSLNPLAGVRSSPISPPQLVV